MEPGEEAAKLALLLLLRKEGRKEGSERVAGKRSLVGALVGANQTGSPQPLSSCHPLFPGLPHVVDRERAGKSKDWQSVRRLSAVFLFWECSFSSRVVAPCSTPHNRTTGASHPCTGHLFPHDAFWKVPFPYNS